MIHLEIISSPDINILTDFQFWQNEVYLGRTSGTIHIKDDNIELIDLAKNFSPKDFCTFIYLLIIFCGVN